MADLPVSRLRLRLVSAITLTNINEGIGVARAAQAADMPCVISFTLETDGCLPTGHKLSEAIEEVDEETGAGPLYYMINCVTRRISPAYWRAARLG